MTFKLRDIRQPFLKTDIVARHCCYRRLILKILNYFYYARLFFRKFPLGLYIVFLKRQCNIAYIVRISFWPKQLYNIDFWLEFWTDCIVYNIIECTKISYSQLKLDFGFLFTSIRPITHLFKLWKKVENLSTSALFLLVFKLYKP